MTCSWTPWKTYFSSMPTKASTPLHRYRSRAFSCVAHTNTQPRTHQPTHPSTYIHTCAMYNHDQHVRVRTCVCVCVWLHVYAQCVVTRMWRKSACLGGRKGGGRKGEEREREWGGERERGVEKERNIDTEQERVCVGERVRPRGAWTWRRWTSSHLAHHRFRFRTKTHQISAPTSSAARCLVCGCR